MSDDLDNLPISIAALESIRFGTSQLLPSEGLGAHLRRRHGQSLEFREYRSYELGDDIRHVDWRASLRHGGRHDWLLRTFEAEERLTLAISVDTRPSMYLPEDRMGAVASFNKGSKMQVACWLVQALAELAELNRDSVLLHRLFQPEGAPDGDVWHGGRDTARGFVQRLITEAPISEDDWNHSHRLDPAPMLTALRPASVLIVISDLYFQDENGAFTAMLRAAQASYREVILVPLDSWPVEAARLRHRRLANVSGVEGVFFDDPITEIDEAFVQEATARIAEHTDRLQHGAQAGGFLSGNWGWPASVDDHAETLRLAFEEQFVSYMPFRTLFAGRA